MGGSGETCPAAGEEQIRSIIAEWAEAAQRCRDAGFDGVELHFGHGFGPAGWFSPVWNHRTDDWGGSLENRSRYGVGVVKAVRRAVGDWPVTVEINSEDGIEGGINHEGMVYFAAQLVKAGIDAFAISRPLINDCGFVSKWTKGPAYPTGCISCNKCQQGQEIIVCRKDEQEASAGEG